MRPDLTESTGVMLCTDHGHYLGEHDIFGKPAAPVYSELGRIPLLVRWPGQPPRDVDALTTSVDLHATIADLFGADVEHPTHGRSLLPVIEGTADAVRELALFGYWGGHVGVTDGRYRYLRGCGESELPTLHVVEPLVHHADSGLPRRSGCPAPTRRATLQPMPGTDVPVIRQPFEPGDRLPFWAGHLPPSDSHLFDVDNDPGEENDRVGSSGEAEMLDALASMLREISAPADLLERIGVR